MIRNNYKFIEGGYREGNFSNYVEVNGFVLGVGLSIFAVFYTPTTPTNTHDHFYENQEYEYNNIEDFDSEYY